MTEPVDQAFLEGLAALRSPSGPVGLVDPDTERLLRLFDSQLGSRHVDLAARDLQAQGAGFYTIGSAGHEGNAAVAAALQPTDPALLHYRSGAFYLERASQVPGQTPLRDMLLGVVAAREEPIAGGRHKVFGNHALAVIPQTSTVASHLPRAMGLALSIARAKKLGVDSPWPTDAVAVCSFGDASANHSTAVGAINTAIHCRYQELPLPLLFVCEDNGLGISVRTPRGWIRQAYGLRPGLEYLAADGSDPVAALAAATRAVDIARSRRRPVFLHLSTVRLMGHAGSDVEAAYRSPGEIAADWRRDPLLGTARALVDRAILTPDEIRERYEAKRREVREVAREVARRPRLETAEQVMAPLALPDPETIARRVTRPVDDDARRAVFGGALPEHGEPLTLAQSINRTLLEALAAHPEVLVFGEDVATKGGVYGVTRGLVARARRARVFDTVLDEQSILGLALGASLSGLLPIPEIQYLAYLHNAIDQLRGEAATLAFFSSGQYRGGMVLRLAGYAYQRGFGGHFHNDNAVASLRDIPGIVVASPSRPEDAAAMLRTCVAAAAEGVVSVFLEPIARYHTKDLLAEGDGLWLGRYVGPDGWSAAHVPIGAGRTHGDGTDLTIVSFGNGLHLTQRVVPRLEARGIRPRVLDLRWLAPLPTADLLREAEVTGRVLVVDETRRSGGVSEGVVTALVDHGYVGRLARVAAEDSFIPLGEAARHVLVSEEQIERAAVSLTRG
ncbi:thiamine pyrophosphate-dependent enzyme [Segeticoccus rhizosphaerae]|uniref:thiamine pyrophosphate-dependent enzyme n=1 Tax=Segeticoccus rhizosphaerae TaxID=1104777 RepID=UPI0010C036EE|nr:MULTISPECIES: thiamine pyrophosphate-dependent enzyme [Intrasporangiaceae]